jgi:glycosyltransferase involved in cell wall biosynthesis
MRAFAVSQALREIGEVEVAVRPLTSFLRSRAPWLWSIGGQGAADWPQGKLAAIQGDFSRVHVFRMSMVRWAEPFFNAVDCDLDLDESESNARSRLGELQCVRGSALEGKHMLREATFYSRQEEQWLKRFRRIYVSSPVEQQRLALRFPELAVRVLPNTVQGIQQRVQKPAQEKFRLLFVGNLNYYPNVDAVRFLADEIVPRLDPRHFEVWVAGGGKARLSDGIRWLGYVDDLGAVYQQADAAIVPIRAGGGTRIKIIEALAYGLPVISTAIGREGLDVDLLAAETAQDFANAARRLRAETGLRDQLATAGQEMVRQRYTAALLPGLLR